MRPALWVIISVSLLFSSGLLMVFNTTSAEIIDRSLDTNIHAALLKQVFSGCLGISLGILVYKVGYQFWLKWSVPLLILGSILLILVFVPGIGQKVNGANRWLRIFGFSFQPSEYIKILIPAAYIRWYLERETAISFLPFLKTLAWLFIPISLILFEPDNGTAALIFLLLATLFFLTRIRLSYWAFPLLVLLAGGMTAAYHMPHTSARIKIYLHPELDLRGKGHQPHQAKIAAGSGQVWGRGLGESLQKLNYLPEARSDYIAAIYAEETGFVGMVLLVALYSMLAYGGFVIAIRSPDRGAFLLAAILTFLISIQAFLNLGVVSGLLPSKGMNLPFFSQGGTSLIFNWIVLFILLDIANKSKLEAEYEA